MIAVVTGMIATYPVGGVVWDYGQYLMGLERLGFDVFYLEDTGWETYDPYLGEYGTDPAFGVSYLADALSGLSPTLAHRWHFRSMTGGTFGLAAEDVAEIVGEADLFLNVSGGTLLRPEYLSSRRKALIDTDPGWNHFVNYPKWDAQPGWQNSHGYRSHDVFFTYAENIGRPGCALPSLGISWIPTRPPVVLDSWQPEKPAEAWTTVMTWDNFRRPIEYAGRTYGTKELEFPKVETLPELTPGVRYELAVGGNEAPAARWQRRGWRVVDSHSVSRTAEDYRSYVQGSRGEFSVAKNVYVATSSGWFSCRSVCYLAAGRPVVVQDTGFTANVPSGEGLLAFSDLEGAAASIGAVEADYEGHREAARMVADEYFSSDLVLGRLVEQAGVG